MIKTQTYLRLLNRAMKFTFLGFLAFYPQGYTGTPAQVCVCMYPCMGRELKKIKS